MQQARSTRAGYKKSRNGCTRCKKRRVKCDEEVPCSACVRHKVPCSLASPDGEHEGIHIPDRSLHPPNNSSSGFNFSSLLSGSLFESPREDADCWVANVELMFHYSTVTYKTLCFSDQVVSTFLHDMPREALSHPYFLREILSLSAYHLAYLHPEKRQSYVLLASKHHDLAVRGIREVLSGPITSANCHALYAAAIFIVVNKFAAFPSCEDYQAHGCLMPIQALVEMFSLVNGISALLMSSEGKSILNGPLKDFFSRTICPHPPSELFQGLLTRVPELKLRAESDALDPKAKLILITTLQSFAECLEDTINRPTVSCPPEMRVQFMWPMMVSRDFLELAGSGHPLALVTLAYYDTLLSWGEPRYWFFEGWAQPLMEAIIEKVRGSEWEDLVSWPASVVLKGKEAPLDAMGIPGIV
ncbi:hypothetical protein B0J15DRAFT_455859 [Fusarium solani]|uniref:Zn(2)-C6 fungal-type domain-containing protein n=1 Tax=Fusarium solani TaxID=169388 RepID=A0A9P9G2I5_FUSSL|nr:uncharacterized protein B0J15DRAFT_455859 [Fusarium solani]KAH7231934.1 hypothetical protein B0J15DRAFT_455859 [Fusarium solani]